MKAIFKTKSNFKNTNGVELKVVEICNFRISCEVPFHGFDKKGNLNIEDDKIVIGDFNIKELVEFRGCVKL